MRKEQTSCEMTARINTKEYWLLKFDGVSGNKDKELEDPKGYGAIEYAYHKMALDAMTRRYDRTDYGKKLHKLSLCWVAHLDFNQLERLC